MDRETMTLDAPDFLLKVNFRKKIGRKLQKITGFFFVSVYHETLHLFNF